MRAAGAGDPGGSRRKRQPAAAITSPAAKFELPKKLEPPSRAASDAARRSGAWGGDKAKAKHQPSQPRQPSPTRTWAPSLPASSSFSSPPSLYPPATKGRSAQAQPSPATVRAGSPEQRRRSSNSSSNIGGSVAGKGSSPGRARPASLLRAAMVNGPASPSPSPPASPRGIFAPSVAAAAATAAAGHMSRRMPPAAAAAAVRQQLRQQQQKLEQTAPVEARLRAVKSVARGGGTVEMQAQRRRQQHQQQQRRTGVGGALWEAWPAAEDEAAAAAALLGDGDVEGLGSDGWKRPQQHRRSVSEDGVELARGGRRTGGGMHALNDSPRSPLSAFAAAFPLLSPQPLPPAAGGLATAAAGRPTALRSPSDHSSTSPSDSPPFLRLHGGSGAGSSPAAPPSYFLPDDRTYKIGGGTGHNSSFHLTAQSSNGGSFADSKGVTVDAGLLLLSPRSASNGGGGLGGGSGWGSASSSVAVGSPIRAVSLEVVHVRDPPPSPQSLQWEIAEPYHAEDNDNEEEEKAEEGTGSSPPRSHREGRRRLNSQQQQQQQQHARPYHGGGGTNGGRVASTNALTSSASTHSPSPPPLAAAAPPELSWRRRWLEPEGVDAESSQRLPAAALARLHNSVTDEQRPHPPLSSSSSSAAAERRPAPHALDYDPVHQVAAAARAVVVKKAHEGAMDALLAPSSSPLGAAPRGRRTQLTLEKEEGEGGPALQRRHEEPPSRRRHARKEKEEEAVEVGFSATAAIYSPDAPPPPSFALHPLYAALIEQQQQQLLQARVGAEDMRRQPRQDPLSRRGEPPASSFVPEVAAEAAAAEAAAAEGEEASSVEAGGVASLPTSVEGEEDGGEAGRVVAAAGEEEEVEGEGQAAAEEEEDEGLASASFPGSCARLSFAVMDYDDEEEEMVMEGAEEEGQALPPSARRREWHRPPSPPHYHPSAVSSLRQGPAAAEEEEEAAEQQQLPPTPPSSAPPAASASAAQGGQLLASVSKYEKLASHSASASSLPPPMLPAEEEEQETGGEEEEEEEEPPPPAAWQQGRVGAGSASPPGGEEEEEDGAAAVASVPVAGAEEEEDERGQQLEESAPPSFVTGREEEEEEEISPVPSPIAATTPLRSMQAEEEEEAGDGGGSSSMAVAALVGEVSPPSFYEEEREVEGGTVVDGGLLDPERGEREVEGAENGSDARFSLQEQEEQQEAAEQGMAVAVMEEAGGGGACVPSPYYDIEPVDWRGTHQAYLEELFGATDVVAALAQYAASFSSSSYPTNNDGEDEEGGVEERGKVLPLSLYIRLEQARLAAAASQQEEVEEESLEAAAAAAQAGQIHRKACFDAANAALRRIVHRYVQAARLLRRSHPPILRHPMPAAPTKRLPSLSHAVAAGKAARAAAKGKRVGAGKWPPPAPVLEEEGKEEEDEEDEEGLLAPQGHYFNEQGHPRLPSAQEALWEVLQALRLHRDHLGAGGGYFDVGAQQQQSAPMDVSVEMAEERARSRRKWEEGEAAEERRVQGEVVDLLMEDLLWETARWLVGVSGAEWRDREEVN